MVDLYKVCSQGMVFVLILASTSPDLMHRGGSYRR